MNLNDKTLEKLRELINEETEYRSGPKLVDFFNRYSNEQDIYERGFPSRWAYTDIKLSQINGSSILEKCIKDLLNPINFIGKLNALDQYIENFNNYLEFDDVKVERAEKTIKIIKFNQISKLIEENISFDEEHIHEQWQKALDRKYEDPEGAITTARTLIETVLKTILKEKGIDYENKDLSELYKEVAKLLNLAPENHQEKIFRQILGGANGIVSGLGTLRNKMSDSHGIGSARVKPKERHSELAVNLAGSMALFIYKTYKETR